MKIKVGVSNRHIHLCQKDANRLFGENYQFHKRNDLGQTGEYACEETVIVNNDNYEFPHVRVMGPIREYTQIEISRDDANNLGINPPMRDSGNVGDNECESIYVTGPQGKYYLENVVILANRHIHCNINDNIGYNNKDIVTVNFNGKKIDNVHIKMKDSYNLEMHVDKTDALAYNLENGDYVDLE